MAYSQEELSEIMFHFHLDQAASHMQCMTNSLPMTHEIKYDFNTHVLKAMNRIWRKQDSNLKELKESFADQASQMDAFLQLFLKINDPDKLLEIMQRHHKLSEVSGNEIIINRQIVEKQQRHLHDATQPLTHLP